MSTRRLMKMKDCYSKTSICFLSLLLLVSCSKNNGGNEPPDPPVITYDASVNILVNEEHQLIRGFGCASAFQPPATTPMTTDEIARLFGKGAGQVGLNFLRIRLAEDDAWRATELKYSKEAIKHGAHILASPWSPPARMKTNKSLVKGKLIADSGAAYAKYLNDFALYMEANGAPLYAVSVQNEPDWEPDYEGCTWSVTEMKNFLKQHGALITATKLLGPELVNSNQSYMNDLLADDAAMANLDIVATHIYGGGIRDLPALRARNKEFWQTEHLDTLNNHVASINTAKEIHECFTKANFNAYFWWYGKRFYGMIGQDGVVTKRGYIVSQFSRFINEGAKRIGTSTNSRSEVLISAYLQACKKVIVAINTGAGQVTQQIIFNGASAGSFKPYVTSETVNTEAKTNITASGDKFSFALPPLSVVTFVEQ